MAITKVPKVMTEGLVESSTVGVANGLATLDGSSIVNRSQLPAFIQEVPSGLVNGSNAVFTLSSSPKAGTVIVFINGLVQRLTTDYTIVGQTITFVSAPEAGQDIYAFFIGA